MQEIPIVEDVRFVYPRVVPWGWIAVWVALALVALFVSARLLKRWNRRRRLVAALCRPHREALQQPPGPPRGIG